MKKEMYIFTTLKFPTHNIDFHLLTASVNAKYYYEMKKEPVENLIHFIAIKLQKRNLQH